MNKETVTALVGWIIGFIITIILFIIAWNWLFAEPVNTSGGTVTRTTANSTVAADGSENNSGSSHPVWGKYTEKDGRYMINMTLDVNHRFIDGYYVGQFVQKLEEKIAKLG